MKVRELIAALSEHDGDLDVLIEGCDCINPAAGCTVQIPNAWGKNPLPYLLIEMTND